MISVASGSPQQSVDLGCGELTATVGFNSSQIQDVGDFNQLVEAGFFHDLRDSSTKFGIAVSSDFFPSLIGLRNGLLVVRISKLHTTTAGGLQCGLCATGNHVAFVFGHGHQNMNQERVGVRIIERRQNPTLEFLKGCNEVEIAGEAVEFGWQLLRKPLALHSRMASAKHPDR